ncbi:MAG: glycosyltransferase family 87 protein [Anaerolineales bacterium]
MKKKDLHPLIYSAIVFFVSAICIFLLYYGMTEYDWHDFDVFYYAARAALDGKSIYIIVGPYELPFWYFPWAAWFYIPFAIFTHSTGLILYKAVSLLSMIFVLWKLKKYYHPGFKWLDISLIFSMLTIMSIQLMQVGQMDYVLLGLATIIMFAVNQKKYILAGLLLPFIWIKPHLFIVFTLFVFWRSGKQTIFTSLGLTACMFLLESFISPGWYNEMWKLLQAGSQRVDGLHFTTFPSLFGFQENWVGTGNLPFTILLVLIATGILWHFRSLPTIPMLSFALLASLFCAPRAYAYDLPLIIPATMWLTSTNFKRTLWIWIFAAIIPLLSISDSITYVVTLLIFTFSTHKSFQVSRNMSMDMIKNGFQNN